MKRILVVLAVLMFIPVMAQPAAAIAPFLSWWDNSEAPGDAFGVGLRRTALGHPRESKPHHYRVAYQE